MTDIAGVLADHLAEGGSYALVSGRTLDGLNPLREAAAVRVVSPGATTRLSVAAGLRMGGARVVAVVERVPLGPPPDPTVLFVTNVAACARDALAAGWSVVQPWAAADVVALLAGADEPTLVFVGGEPELEFADPPAPRRTRLWLDGDLATLVASGPAVPATVRLAERLQDRGMDIAAVEIAVLTSPGQVALAGGEGLLVAGRDTVAALRGSTWPDLETTPVPLAGQDEADVVGAVLAAVHPS